MCSSCILNPVADELGGVFSDLLFLDQAIDDDTPHWNSEFMEPVDEPGDDRNGKAFRQGHKEEGG